MSDVSPAMMPVRAQRVGAPESEKGIDPGIAVALSGGGYRAMLFHLGFLWRMRDAGLLARVARFSSVSGGSITAGALAVAWPKLDFGDDGASFRGLVAAPLLGLAARTIDWQAALIGRIPGLAGTWAARAYDKHLYGGAKLADLTGRPRFTFNATSLHSGKLVRINQEYFADWTTGRWGIGDMALSTAVAASSAFPPVLAPVVIDLARHPALPATGTIHAAPAKLFLADGGVYDNLGIETVWKRFRTVYVSDAGAAFTYDADGTRLLSLLALRTTFIMQDQIGALRFRLMKHGYDADPASEGFRRGFLVSSDYFVDPRPAGGLAFTLANAKALAATKTGLKALPDAIARGLVNWGYIATDDRLRGQPTPPAGRCALPFPECPVG